MSQSTLIRNNNAFLEFEVRKPAKSSQAKNNLPTALKVLVGAVMVASVVYLTMPTSVPVHEKHLQAPPPPPGPPGGATPPTPPGSPGGAIPPPPPGPPGGAAPPAQLEKNAITKATVYVSYLEECTQGSDGCSKNAPYKIKTRLPDGAKIALYAKPKDEAAFKTYTISGSFTSTKSFTFKGDDFKQFKRFAKKEDKDKRVKLCVTLKDKKEDCKKVKLNSGDAKKSGTQIKIRIAYIKKADGKYVAKQVKKNIYFK